MSIYKKFKKMANKCGQDISSDILNSTRTTESTNKTQKCNHCQIRSFFYNKSGVASAPRGIDTKCKCKHLKLSISKKSSTSKKQLGSVKRRCQRVSMHRKLYDAASGCADYNSDGSLVNGCVLNANGSEFSQFGQLQVWYV